MNGTEVYDLIKLISATSSRTEKEALLKANIDDPLLQKVLKAALDPYITYGIAKMPTPNLGGPPLAEITMDSAVWAVLATLANRTLTGHAARDAVTMWLEMLTEFNGELLTWIITKDLRAGFTANTVNRVMKGLIPSFKVMLAHKYEQKRIKKWPVFVEPKLDGVRVIAFVTPTDVKFYSRSGKEFTTFEHLKAPLLDLRPTQLGMSYVLDGEVVSGNFNETISQVRRSSAQATDAEYHVFDLLPLNLFTDGVPLELTYEDRRKILGIAIQGSDKVKLIPHRLAYNHDEVLAIYNTIRDDGGEGVIIKPADGLYTLRRSHAWMKIKGVESVDVPVTGTFEGLGKYGGMLGGLIVDLDGVEVRVGGGFSDQQRVEFWNSEDDIVIGRLIEVEYHEKTPDGSLRHPRFLRFRDDKQAVA